MSSRDPPTEYQAFITEVSVEASRLAKHYRTEVRCRKGCDHCCDAISVLPIEAEVLRRFLASQGAPDDGSLAPRRRDRCVFLTRDGACAVYEARPLICRTHGLPLAYRLYEYDINGLPLHGSVPQYMDIYCELNFTKLDEDSANGYFDVHGRVNMDEANRRLAILNAAFLRSEEGSLYVGRDRVVLSELLDATRQGAQPPLES